MLFLRLSYQCFSEKILRTLSLYNLSTLGDSKLDCSASSRANTTKLGQDTARGYSCDMLESQEHPTTGSYRIFRFWDGLPEATDGRSPRSARGTPFSAEAYRAALASFLCSRRLTEV